MPITSNNALISESLFDFWLGQISASAALRRPLARIVRITPASQDAVTLELKANRNFAGFGPGQHIPVTAEVNGARVTRSYSPIRPMNKRRRVFITVKREPGGTLSNHFCDEARGGDILELGPPFGEFANFNFSEPLLLLAAGSGITPMACLLQHAAQHHPQANIHLIYWAREEDDFCFRNELEDIAGRLINVRCEFITTRSNGDSPEGTRISSSLLQAHVSELPSRFALACGPARFIEAARVATLGQARQFVAESFSRPALVSNDSNHESREGSVQVRLSRSNKVLKIARSANLLEALEANGLTPAHGCRMGICNTCACTRISGTTRNHATGQLDAEPAGALRICTSSAETDLTIEL